MTNCMTFLFLKCYSCVCFGSMYIKKLAYQKKKKKERKHDNLKPIGCNKCSSKREVFIVTQILPQETKLNRQPNFTYL